MKIILSRKGFDQKAGCVPSPILPDGTLLSLPIPDEPPSKIRYKDIHINGEPIGNIVEDLTNRNTKGSALAHLDPDLNHSAYPRRPHWRPLFGPGRPAHSHLKAQGVGVGDLFLFFGWFRETEIFEGKYRYVKGAPNRHVIFGWLQVGAVISVEKDVLLPWATYHPHFQAPGSTVYVSRASLDLNGLKKNISGGGVFEKYREELCLTCAGEANRSVWKLPKWFYPQNGRPPLSHHEDIGRWKLEDEHTILQSVGRGQEFVLDADKYPKAISWARELITSAAA